MDILNFLTTLCGSLDSSLLNLLHETAVAFGFFLTPVMNFLSTLGENGIFIFAVGAVMLLFKKTRKAGAAIIICVVLTGVLNTLILKNVFARPRPFADNGIYYSFWQFVGSPAESGYSFPSGHTTVAVAAATAVFLSFKNRCRIAVFAFPLLVGISRVYLAVHYPTDIIAALFIGAALGVASFFLTKQVFKLITAKFKTAEI